MSSLLLVFRQAFWPPLLSIPDLLQQGASQPDESTQNKIRPQRHVRIAYQITGDGPFNVVWAPGTMSHLDLHWEIAQRALFFERFSKFCGLIRFDKRGTGLSDRHTPLRSGPIPPLTLADLKF
jgi:hypothetical protein